MPWGVPVDGKFHAPETVWDSADDLTADERMHPTKGRTVGDWRARSRVAGRSRIPLDYKKGAR